MSSHILLLAAAEKEHNDAEKLYNEAQKLDCEETKNKTKKELQLKKSKLKKQKTKAMTYKKKNNKRNEDTGTSIVERTKRAAKISKRLKIIVGYFQLLSAAEASYSIP